MVSDQLARRGIHDPSIVDRPCRNKLARLKDCGCAGGSDQPQAMSATWRLRGKSHRVTSLMVQMAGRRQHFRPRPFWSTEFLYLATVHGRVIALSPETGAEIRKYDPGVDPAVERGEFANRGVTYWQAVGAVEGQACERMILVATVDARLIALDAARGTPCPDRLAANPCAQSQVEEVAGMR
jgi:outer membrane protein assembly factor BamB